MKDNHVLRDELKRMIAKSQRALRTAKDNFRNADYESASSKGYYSVFHIMQAALLTKGLTYAKHSGVISGFSLHFIKNGIFPKDFSKKIRHLMQDREIGDYSYFLSIEREQARQDIKIASDIAARVILYLKKFTSKD